jgi:phosphate transport system substrate-binding protein
MRKLRFVLLLVLVVSCKRITTENIIIKGSDTEINVVLELAEAFMDADSSVSIAITGGGSGVGISALFSGRCDIALSSRPLNSYEEALIMRRGIRLVTNIFATDAIAIICHPSKNISSLTLDELAKIYSGEITQWSEVGGPAGKISLYGRQSNSGTYAYFRENVVKADFSTDVKEMSGTAQIVEGVKQDVNAIGYVGLGYILDQQGKLYPGVHVIALSLSDTSQPQTPLNKTEVLAGHYPLTRPLYQFTIGEPTGKIKEFIAFEKSVEGQKIIKKNGFLPASLKTQTPHL